MRKTERKKIIKEEIIDDNFLKINGKYKLILAEGSFVKADAYWISPIGKIVPVITTHIDTIFQNPEIFRLTKEKIKDVYDKFGEKLGQEGKAREKILIDLIQKGWLRVRHYTRMGSWTINAKTLSKKVKDHIQNFASLLIDKGIDKYDEVKIDTTNGKKSLTVLDLSNDALYNENLNINNIKANVMKKSELRQLIREEILNEKSDKEGFINVKLLGQDNKKIFVNLMTTDYSNTTSILRDAGYGDFKVMDWKVYPGKIIKVK